MSSNEETSRIKNIILEIDQQLSSKGRKYTHKNIEQSLSSSDTECLPQTTDIFIKLVSNKYSDLYHDTVFISDYNAALIEAVKESGREDLLKYKI